MGFVTGEGPNRGQISFRLADEGLPKSAEGALLFALEGMPEIHRLEINDGWLTSYVLRAPSGAAGDKAIKRVYQTVRDVIHEVRDEQLAPSTRAKKTTT